MDKIDVFDNSAVIMMRKSPPKIISWITIITISLIAFLIVSIFYKYNRYTNYIGTIVKEDEQYYVKLFIEENKIITFSDSKLLINSKVVEYQIETISKNYYLNEHSEKMYEVSLRCVLPQNLIIANNLVQLRFESLKTTIMHNVIENIKREMS